MTMEKSKNHRKRHVPPGPCGVWYQSHQHQSNSNGGSGSQKQRKKTKAKSTSASSSSPQSLLMSCTQEEQEEDDVLMSQSDEKAKSSIRRRRRHNNNTTDWQNNVTCISPAWTKMLLDLKFVTPYFDPSIGSDYKSKYNYLRPYIPSQYVLIYELICGRYDFMKLTGEQCVLVLVHSVESSIHHNIWTVELQDETGACIRAWMEPRFIRQQLQQQAYSSVNSGTGNVDGTNQNSTAGSSGDNSNIIRPGVVWRIQNFGMMVIKPNHSERLERTLLISNRHIIQYWKPEVVLEEQDSEKIQKHYIDLMQKRQDLTDQYRKDHHYNHEHTQISDDQEDEHGPPEEEVEEEDEEMEHASAHSNSDDKVIEGGYRIRTMPIKATMPHATRKKVTQSVTASKHNSCNADQGSGAEESQLIDGEILASQRNQDERQSQTHFSQHFVSNSNPYNSLRTSLSSSSQKRCHEVDTNILHAQSQNQSRSASSVCVIMSNAQEVRHPESPELHTQEINRSTQAETSSSQQETQDTCQIHSQSNHKAEDQAKRKRKDKKKKKNNKDRKNNNEDNTKSQPSSAFFASPKCSDAKDSENDKSPLSPWTPPPTSRTTPSTIWNAPDETVLEMLVEEEEERTNVAVTITANGTHGTDDIPGTDPNDKTHVEEERDREEEENDDKAENIIPKNSITGTAGSLFEASVWDGMDMTGLDDEF